MRTRTRAASLIAALTLVAAACGDDSATTDATDTTAAAAATTAASDVVADDASDGSDGADAMTDDMDDMSGDHEHAHGDLVEANPSSAPTIAIEALPDPKAGVNVAAVLTNFTITPENASTEHVDGEGHMHVYVDGEKIGRLYNEWVHLGLDAGEHEITVEVSANDHRTYGVGGEPIAATTIVSVPEPASGHGHDGPVDVVGDPPTILLETSDDPKSGVNVEVTTSGFAITPEHASTEHVEGEGHMHVYVDGEKIGRLYGPWVHIDGLADGDHDITVELSANDHRAYAVNGTPIVATATVTFDDGVEAPTDTDDHDDMDEAAEVPDADQVISLTVAGGEVEGGPQTVAVELGTTVAIVVESDTAEEIHVHGYDVYADLDGTNPATVTFDATIPGVFEAELEGSGRLLVELEVS